MKTDPPQKGPRTPQVASETSTASEADQPGRIVPARDGLEKEKNPTLPQHAQPQQPVPRLPKGVARKHHRDAGEAEGISPTLPLERLPSDLPVVEAPPPGTKATEEPHTVASHPLDRIGASSSDDSIEGASRSDDDAGDVSVSYTPLNVYFEDGAASEVKPTARLSEQDDVPSVAKQLVNPDYRARHGLKPLEAVPELPSEGETELWFAPMGHDRATGMPPPTTTKFREVKPSISLATGMVGLTPSVLEALGLQMTRKGQRVAWIDLQNPLLIKGFYRANCATREKVMNLMSTAKIGISFKDNHVPPTFWRRIKNKVKGAFESNKLTVRGDVAFMLRLSHKTDHGRAFGVAVCAARASAIDDLLAITKNHRFLTSGILLDATLEIAEIVAFEEPSHVSASLNAAGDIICAYIAAADADKTIAKDGRLLADAINTAAGEKTSDLRLRGALVGLYVAGAYKFSLAATKRDEESIKRYKQFNGLLWDSLNAVTFPGVAAVTAILKTASEELITRAFVPRDFRGQLIERLGDIKYAIEKGHEKNISPDDLITGKEFLNGKVMDWIDIALNCNGIL